MNVLVTGGTGTLGSEFVDVEGTRRLVEASEGLGVDHFISEGREGD